MSMVYILLPLSLLLGALAVGVFIWAAKKGQFDDLETPAYRVLLDDVEECGGEVGGEEESGMESSGEVPDRPESAGPGTT